MYLYYAIFILVAVFILYICIYIFIHVDKSIVISDGDVMLKHPYQIENLSGNEGAINHVSKILKTVLPKIFKTVETSWGDDEM